MKLFIHELKEVVISRFTLPVADTKVFVYFYVNNLLPNKRNVFFTFIIEIRMRQSSATKITTSDQLYLVPITERSVINY